MGWGIRPSPGRVWACSPGVARTCMLPYVASAARTTRVPENPISTFLFIATPTVREAQWISARAIAIARECSARTLKPICRARPQEYRASSSYASNLLAALLFPHRRLAVGVGHFQHAIVGRIAFLREDMLDRQLLLASDHVARIDELVAVPSGGRHVHP